ncbi:hypothetical protein [Neorhizobium galegae]|uniref:hypothetical protein n=1 Tax=Neorhizobium galegae TaxID=399 RepID=UPI001F29283D|nr:hypothetical protein [Neorhizobium galegae]UIK05031.1 hypothetical protein LZK81_20640 [Neorhizobium galegae]
MVEFKFNPAASPLADLYAQWVPLYLAQRTLDDEAAAPLQEPLLALEKAIEDQPITTMQDFHYHQTAMSCFGNLCPDYSGDRLKGIVDLALAEAKEREDLLAMIDQHKAGYRACEDYPGETEEPEFAILSDRELELLDALVEHPLRSIGNIILRGRYLAALHEAGWLGYEQAQAFLETFASIGSDVRG